MVSRLSASNIKRSVARRMLRPILNYVYETRVVIGGKDSRLVIGERVATANAIFNVSSGNIHIGSRTILSHNVMVITGQHRFNEGKRFSLDPKYDDGSWGGGLEEVPDHGFDISIGEGVFIGAGAIILGGVSIGDNCIIGAGAVVTKSFPSYSVVVGVPARVIGDTRNY